MPRLRHVHRWHVDPGDPIFYDCPCGARLNKVCALTLGLYGRGPWIVSPTEYKRVRAEISASGLVRRGRHVVRELPDALLLGVAR